jgi:DNA-binding NtrC family response regulator
MRIGGQKPIEVNVRVIAATNRKPKDAVDQGKLREDLYYRLNVFPIPLPTLRERADDIELLARHFLGFANQEAGTKKEFSSAALQRLRSHSWPGNVRELRNVVQRAYIMAPDVIGVEAIPIETEEVSGNGLEIRVGTSLAEAERRLILATLEHCEGDKKKAAAILRISVKTLYNRINEYKGGKG